MQNRNNNLMWIVLVAILVIVNLTIMSFIWFGGNNIRNQHPPLKNGVAEGYILKELNFDSTQKAAFFELKNQHHESIHLIKEQIKIAKESFFNLLKDTTTTEASIMTASDRISQLEKQIEIKTFHHFQQLRVICNADQKKKFDNIISQVVKMNAPMQGPPHHHGELKVGGGEFPPPPKEGQMVPREGNSPPIDGDFPAFPEGK